MFVRRFTGSSDLDRFASVNGPLAMPVFLLTMHLTP